MSEATRNARTHLVVVPHSHWDREWYRTHEQFRVRLVRLVDRVLDLLEADASFRCFTLDGQTIVVDDYLAVRPEARSRLERLVREGRLLVGPWTVLPDEWLVSGEALVRNLRMGLARARELGGAMRVGYVPDQFGHVGQLPQIFAGFGLDAAVLWRGVGADVDRTLFDWEAPDGTRLFTVWLARSYSNGANLPAWPEGTAERLRGEIERLGRRSPIPTLLVMNGNDHALPDPELPRLLEKARPLLGGASLEIGSLPGYVARARAEASAPLQLHRGELRSGLRAPLLVGCASARIPQKQRDFANDRLLVRYLEPLAAWLGLVGGRPDPGLIELAWRTALENHPHDSICGCSIDAVHEQMEPRFARVRELATAELERVFHELAARVAAPPRAFGGVQGADFVVWNPNAAGAAPVEALIETDLTGTLCVRDAGGARLAAAVERVEPASTLLAVELPRAAIHSILRNVGAEFIGRRVRDLAWQQGADGALHATLVLTRVEAREPDLRGRVEEFAHALARSSDEAVRFRAVLPPLVRVRFVDVLPGHGVRRYRLAAGRAPRAGELAAERLPGGGAAIQNERFRVEVGADGRVAIARRPDGLRVEDALRVVSEGDRGDEYNFDPVPGAPPVERPEAVRVQLERATPVSAALRVHARYRVPAGLDASRVARSRRAVALPVELRIALFAGVDRVDVELRLDNTARDHRVRLHVRAPFAARRFEVESAFEVAGRPIAPEAEAGERRPAERPIGATPERTFATIDDGRRALTVANRGNPEAEAVPEPDGTSSLAITLLRAVGWLSRGDLALRPGHAGPPLATPGAQVPGAHVAELSIRWHAAGDPLRIAEAHRFAYRPLAAQRDGDDAGEIADGARLVQVDDPELVVSALEPLAGGRALVRVYNASHRPRPAALRVHGSPALDPVDLAGEPLGGGATAAPLRPWQIASFLTR
jgi:alpha-mannosidase